MDILYTKPIREIEGAMARSDGFIKFPNTKARMPNGGVREYNTKWRRGTKTKESKTARHEYYGTMHRSKNYKVHRLICASFHGPSPEGKDVVIHIDENSLNNRPENLRWGTQKENMNAAGFLEYCAGRTGKNSPTSKGAAAKKLRESST